VWKFFIAILLLCEASRGQEAKTMILAASRAGIVELIDPATLETVGRIHFDLPRRTAGLNGVSASADGSTLYVEGPGASFQGGCCELYSVDLASMRTTVAASIAGTRSRNAFVTSGSITYAGTYIEGSGDRWHLSPDRRWLFGVRNFRGPVLDMYDTAERRIARQLVPEGHNGGWATGAWAGKNFYFFVDNNTGSGRLWAVSPETAQLDAGVAVQAFGQVAGCREPVPIDTVSLGNRLFLYETFGSKVDRRDRCRGVPGGAWLLDPAAGSLSHQIAPDSHFAMLLSDPEEALLYGLVAPGDANWLSAPVPLVRINAADGRILQSRLLDAGVWHIALAPLSVVPHGDVRISGLPYN